MKTLEEIVKDVLYETIKLSNGQPSIATIERMAGTSRRLAKDLDLYVEARVVQRVKELQERVHSAFEAAEEEMKRLSGEVERIKSYMSNNRS